MTSTEPCTAAGVDDQSLDDFNKDLENYLYKLWNRMASVKLSSATGSACGFINPVEAADRWLSRRVADLHATVSQRADGPQAGVGAAAGADL